MAKGRSFSFKTDPMGSMTARTGKYLANLDAELVKRMSASIDLVYNTATHMRPRVTKIEQQRINFNAGRNRQASTYRVSDPNALYGVPVQSGDLQGSIESKLDFSLLTGKAIGRVFTKGIPYAGRIEFGFGRQQPRAFMRPAWKLNEAHVVRIFEAPIKPI
jgi:hypothetical protein